MLIATPMQPQPACCLLPTGLAGRWRASEAGGGPGGRRRPGGAFPTVLWHNSVCIAYTQPSPVGRASVFLAHVCEKARTITRVMVSGRYRNPTGILSACTRQGVCTNAHYG